LEQKHARRDPAAMPAAEAWAVATGAHAPALGQSGRIAVGEPADFFVACDDHGVLGPGDLVNNLVYAATGAVVAHTVVDGRVVVRGGVVDDEPEIRARAYECARRLGVG
jgi:cytosine/adenosine deaminase-related metal-dependent hydrolase